VFSRFEKRNLAFTAAQIAPLRPNEIAGASGLSADAISTS
jgi:hypothetical protein